MRTHAEERRDFPQATADKDQDMLAAHMYKADAIDDACCFETLPIPSGVVRG